MTANGVCGVGSSVSGTSLLTFTAGTGTFAKSFTDDPVLPGTTVTLEFTITNTGGGALTDLQFTDDLDAALSGLAATGLPASNICGAGSQISGTSSLSFTGGNVPDMGSCTFGVTLQVPADAMPDTYMNATSKLQAGVSTIADAATDSLEVLEPADLTVDPASDLVSSGIEGGPFTPSSEDYMLENLGGVPLDFTALGDEAFFDVTVTPPGGTIPAGGMVTVTVEFNMTAEGLSAADYSGTVTFTNLTNGMGDTTRGVDLAVLLPADDIAISFAPGSGFWARLNDATWLALQTTSPEILAAGDMDGNGQDEIIADFGPGLGLWIWRNNSAFEPLHATSPEALAVGNIDGDAQGKADVVVAFGADGLWVRMNDSSWVQLSSESPLSLATGDMDGNGQDEILAGFGPGFGLQIYRNNTAFEVLHGGTAGLLATGNIDGDAGGKADVVVDLGAGGLWVRLNDSTWKPLAALSAQSMATGDLDGNGQDEIVAGFGPGQGLFIYRNNTAFEPLLATSAEVVVTANMDGDATGKDEAVVGLGPGLGTWIRRNDSSWEPLSAISSQAMASGNFDGD